MCINELLSMWVGLARTIYIRCMYGIFGREIAKYTVYVYDWPTLYVRHAASVLMDLQQTPNSQKVTLCH